MKHHVHPEIRNIPHLGREISRGTHTRSHRWRKRGPAGVQTCHREVVQVGAIVTIEGMLERSQTVLIVMGTGFEKSTCCQPEMHSPVNVANTSGVPLLARGWQRG